MKYDHPRFLIACMLAGLLSVTAAISVSAADVETRTLTLQQCIDLALEQDHSRPASQYAVAAAEAQHRQALAGYWPHLTLNAAYERLDQSPNFIFPAGNMQIPPQSIGVPSSSIRTPGLTVAIPAHAFGPGFPPSAVQVPVAPQTVRVPSQSFNLPGQAFPIPEQDISLMDEDSWYASLEAKWLLWDGGMRQSLRAQSRAGLDAAGEALRRTELEITDSVKRLYHGAVLARQLRKLGEDTLARMEATLSLTETMYKEGAGKVKKTDFLDNKIMVETLRSAVALLEKNESMAQAALAFTIGLAWDASVIPTDKAISFSTSAVELETLVGEAYAFSPDWKRLEAGIRAAEGALREARSEHYPKLALTGQLHQWWNDLDSGMATDRNKEGWKVGVGVEVPIFRGFLTRNKVKEMRARLSKIKEEQLLFHEGLGIQVRDIVMGLIAAEKRFHSTQDAMESSVENRDLNTRAYQNDLVETEDVIRAQLMEALMTAQHYRMRYDNVALRSKLALVVGTEIEKTLVGEP